MTTLLSLKTGIKFTDTFIKFVLNLYGCQLPTLLAADEYANKLYFYISLKNKNNTTNLPIYNLNTLPHYSSLPSSIPTMLLKAAASCWRSSSRGGLSARTPIIMGLPLRVRRRFVTRRRSTIPLCRQSNSKCGIVSAERLHQRQSVGPLFR